MRKIHILASAFFAFFAVGAVAASSAFAVETLPAEYLWNGAVIAEGAELPIDTTNSPETSELLLEDMKALGGAVDLLCSGLFVGVIHGPKNLLITEVLNLAMNSSIILCTIKVPKGACIGTEAEVTAVHLGWLIEPLLEGAIFVLMLIKAEGVAGNPGYKTTCKTILGNQSDECTGEFGALAKNVAGGIEGEFSETNEEVNKPGDCSSGGAKVWLLAGAGLTTDTAGGTLSLSSV